MSRRPWRLAVAAMLGTAVASAAADSPSLVFEPASGRVLHHEGAHRHWRPASLTKLMTLYVVFAEMAERRLAPDDALTASRHAASQPPTRLGLRAGATITAREAVLAVITASANDAAVVLAERVAGTETAFAERMNATARRLGMRRSLFRNASGLPHREQVTTAHDVGLLAQRLLADFPDRYPLFATRTLRFGGRTHRTTNGLLASYTGSDGLKTGFTCGAGFNLAASAVRDDRRLVAVLLGASSGWARNRAVARLLDEGFNRLADEPAETTVLAAIPRGAETRAPAPVRLSTEACVKAAGRRPRLEPGNLPGWGVLLGVFASREAARAATRDAASRLRGVAEGGIAVILERRFERGTSFKALLVGYEPESAGSACKALWAGEITCVPQPPAVINDRNYAVR